MMVDPPLRDLADHLLDDLAEIEAGVAGYRGGRLSAYQTVAVQLRNILTDTSRAGPLLQRVVPDATFHALRSAPMRTDIPPGALVWEFNPRGSMNLGGGPSIITLDVTDELVDVETWLDDWIVSRGVRIRDLIHEVASKDAAHTDPSAGPAMNRLEANQLLVNAGVRVDVARPTLIGIGDYVSRRIRELLRTGSGAS